MLSKITNSEKHFCTIYFRTQDGLLQVPCRSELDYTAHTFFTVPTTHYALLVVQATLKKWDYKILFKEII